jgi:hypothetical protein
MLWCIVQFLFARSSMRASCVAIDLAEYMTDKDLRDMADYFKAVVENRQTRRADSGN